ncbi:MAG: SUMF1/EgtB/PvdO family nonheme iron enzyme [Anaerolineae bacterium]|nr:SUMF1/EgtB/PvdO family nonheme iron enzyme [Anaerolineae bacterium]
MADAFISYRRKPSATLALLVQEKLKNPHGIDAYVDVTRTDSTRVQFPQRLMQAIADAPTFICLLGEGTLESEWVLKEIQRAYELGKHCIPVFQESYIPPTQEDEAVNYLLSFDGVHIFDIKNVLVDQSIAQIASLVPQAPQSRSRWRSRIGVVLALLTVFIVFIGALLIALSGNQPPVVGTTPSTTTAVAQGLSEATTPEATVTVSGLATADTRTEIALNLPTPTIDVQATVLARQGQAIAETATQHILDLAATATASTPTPVVDVEATINAALTGTSQSLTQIAEWTPTRSPMEAALERARNFSGGNEDWEPFEWDFDGVPMMLVPVGCFEMGENGEGGRQCHEEPFWIDKYEVTNAEYERFVAAGGYENPDYWTDAGWAWKQENEINGPEDNEDLTAPDQPRVGVSWYEAVAYANWRGGRLPTEAEWEYAARGPDGWLYPWGNEWSGDNAVWSGNSGSRTAEVGSRPAGTSWVGALDMSGNVWEWVSSLYLSYPYDTEDVRDNMDAQGNRMLRGGSWGSLRDYERAVYRREFNPYSRLYSFGFRVVRPPSS